MKRYPWVEFMAHHGRRIAICVAAMVPAIGAYGFYRSGIPELLVGSVPAAFVVYALMRVVVELIEVIADTLLPR